MECENSERFLETALAELGELNIDYLDIWCFRIDSMENKLNRMFNFMAKRAETVAMQCFDVKNVIFDEKKVIFDAKNGNLESNENKIGTKNAAILCEKAENDKCVKKSFSCLAQQIYGALKKLNEMKKEKVKKVQEAQRKKDEIAKNKMGEMNEKLMVKMDNKRKEMVKKKSDLGLGVGTGEFYQKFCGFGDDGNVLFYF